VNKRQRPHGKYVPILADGHVRLYLPVERYDEIDSMRSGGYELDDQSQDLLKIVRRIKEAEKQRKESEQIKREFINKTVSDFSREIGSIDIICPYCLGRINHNWPRDQGAILCGWYDLATGECNGNASFSIDRANLMLGVPEVERYICPVKKANLALAIYDFRYLKEEIEWRVKEIRKSTLSETSFCDAELAKIFPFRVSVRRTSRVFKELLCSLIKKDAIDWVNSLALGDLASLLEKGCA